MPRTVSSRAVAKASAAGGPRESTDALSSSAAVETGALSLRAIRDRVDAHAVEVLRKLLPERVLRLDAILTGEDVFTGQVTLDQVRTASASSLSALLTSSEGQQQLQQNEHAKDSAETSQPAPTKKRKVADTAAVEEGVTSASSARTGATAIETSTEDVSQVVAGTHKFIIHMEQLLVAELRDVIDLTNSLKVWIQLNIPKIEDGNNFGVGIQEEVIAELARAEDSAFGVLDGITQYHAQRAKLVSKVAKYPGIADYLEAVIELDRKEFIDLRMNLTEQRNATAILVDMIQKNHDKIVKPRDSQTMGMY